MPARRFMADIVPDSIPDHGARASYWRIFEQAGPAHAWPAAAFRVVQPEVVLGHARVAGCDSACSAHPVGRPSRQENLVSEARLTDDSKFGVSEPSRESGMFPLTIEFPGA